MKFFKLLGISLLFLVLAGCAIGNQYDYRIASVSLPLTGDGELGVGVVDNRSYVLSGDKDPDFIGVKRALLSNPWNVTTASGQSLTDDMAKSLENSLRNSGYTVSSLRLSSGESSIVASTIAESGKSKNIVLTVTEWKTDIYLKMSLHFNLLLRVISKDGTTIAKNHMQGDEIIGGGGFASQNARTAMAAFETKIGRLFNNEAILDALKN